MKTFLGEYFNPINFWEKIIQTDLMMINEL